MLREADGQYVLSSPLPTLAIPSSLHDSLMARLDRLGPVKEVAQIGAAIGREFTYDILKAVAGRPDDRLGDELDQLVEAGLIFSRGGRRRHHSSSSTPSSRTRPMARCCAAGARSFMPEIATALEEQARATLESRHVGRRTVRLYWHIIGSGLRSGKEPSHTRWKAAERARTLFARPEAINHYWQALDLLERLPHTSEQQPRPLRRSLCRWFSFRVGGGTRMG